MFEFFSLKETLTTTMVLFAVIDIVGSIPIIVSLKQKFGKIEAERATIVACVLMIAFLFIGNNILKFIGVDVNSFAIAGAFVIFIIAVEMILGIEIQKNTESKSASIVPIAFPLIAGAGTLTTTLSLRAEYHDINIIAGIILNTIFVYLVLKSANWLEQKMGDGTLQVLQKVFGIILLAISIKLFTANFAQLFSTYVNF
ncbi:MarC family protein [Chryseobacterium sp.]|uniref:MarC family protein n=1 Tax=Chryseobacterium sp. TaxID=1871047 RepID=UPI0011C8824F|nr:MarC family protein [Chryseobacterium sp.]TXF79339.1 MarC family protein [Chryseobacterium sp.]